MPKMLSDAQHKVVFVPGNGIEDHHAPTVAELAATGVLDISCLVTMANFTLGATGENAIDDPALCARANDKVPGRITYEGGMDFFRYTTDAEDKAWNLFVEKGIEGFLVRRIGKDYDEPFVATDDVQVYQVITGTPMIPPPTEGFEKFKQMFYVQSAQTDERAVVAA